MKKVVFQEGSGSWTYENNKLSKQYKDTKRSSTELSPIQSLFQKKEEYNYKHKKIEGTKHIQTLSYEI